MASTKSFDHHARMNLRLSPMRILLLLCSILLLPTDFPTVDAAAIVDDENNGERQHRRPRRRDPRDRPNFVLLFMDDLGYSDLGFTGHPSTYTPNIDRLAAQGKVLSSWYSACAACTGSRAGLMTGRQWTRTGLPIVLGPTGSQGLNLNETTLGEQLKSGGYNTAIVGKWHLGQRLSYLPGNRGFDYYLGIPYSDDMGDGWTSQCPTSSGDGDDDEIYSQKLERRLLDKMCRNGNRSFAEAYLGMGLVADDDDDNEFFSCEDPAGNYLPLIYQEHNKTRIVEQPLDFTTLANKYRDFAVKFLERHAAEPFFLYMPFSHVHVTSPSQPNLQYAGCAFKNTTRRGPFGDALSEADDIVGAVVDTLRRLDLEENTLIIFTSDNGPWLSRGLSAGSAGLFTGRFAGYYETGKATTWEGGIRMPAFAYWKGIIPPYSRSAEIVSSLDVFPTLSTLAGVPLPTDRNFDGKDMTDVILNDGTSQHRDSFLFFYGSCHVDEPYYTVTAVRHGPYKAHWCTAPELTYGPNKTMVRVYDRYPLMFDVEVDPSESEPVAIGNVLPDDHADREAMERIVKAYAMEKATFQFGDVKIIPDGPGEGPGRYGLCCDRERNCDCRPSDENEARQNDKEWKTLLSGFFQVGSKSHHDRYHEVLNEEEPWPPRTLAQRRLHQM